MNTILATLEGFDASHVLALINAVGGRDNALGLASGFKKATVEDVIRVLIGKHVRFVIPEGFKFPQVDFNPSYYCKQPGKLDFAAIAELGKRLFPQGRGHLSATQVEEGCRELEEQVSADPQVANLFAIKDPRRGIRLPWCLPQMEVDVRNPGKAIHDVFKPAIKAAYEDVFAGRQFVDYREQETDGQVTIVDESQLRLVSALREGPVYGWIFPAVFQGIGIEGDRALVKTLPTKQNFVLGGFDSLAAMALHPQVLARDSKTPVMDLAAFQWQDPDFSLYLGPDDVELEFGYRDLGASENYSGALSVFGQPGR